MSSPDDTDKADTTAKAAQNTDGVKGGPIILKKILENLTELEVEISRGIRKRTKAIIVACSVVAYFLSSLLFMYLEDNMGAGDCLYFAVVVVTTVGYGDFLPSSDGAKLFVVFWSHFALVIVAVSLGIVQDFLIDRSIIQAIGSSGDEGLLEKEKQRKKRRLRMVTSVVVYVLFLLLGMIFFALDTNDWSEDESKWINGIYLSVITLTTIGFGDLTPTTDQAKIFTSLYMLLGIPVFGYMLAHCNELLFGSSPELTIRHIKGGLTRQKYDTMDAFVKKMHKQGVGNYMGQKEDQISRFEFLTFVLVQNEVLDLAKVKDLMKNFEDLDVTNTGFIGQADAERASAGVTASEGNSVPDQKQKEPRPENALETDV